MDKKTNNTATLRFQKTGRNHICLLLLFVSTISCSHLKTAGLFVAGMAASVATHEAGHWIATGGDIDFCGLNWRCDYEVNDFQRNAGLMAQALASEAILWSGSEGPFWAGFLGTNLVEELTYPTIRRNDGDFAHVANKTVWSVVWIGHGASVAARMARKEAWRWVIAPGMVGYLKEF